ncbi:hypothetical protein Taro_055257 [Colocasia esculenta]|uniref:Trypsin/chymotrypsin inhibitor n=1 Tax=Colocasia esculenta TaxID=4460 RepID=A0A843XQJ3_COLES|nr:hypothetical protein [Colocasia esculenta]
MVFILLLVSSLLLTARAAAAASNPVLDVDGNELRRGHHYYAMSVMRPGGGLTLAPNASCPLNVSRAPFPDYSGRPLAFFPENADDDTVKEGSTLYIMFPEPTECPQSTVWTLDRKAGFVTTGGTTSSAIGPHNSRFAIRKARYASSQPDHYQVEVCPCSTGVQRPSCRMGCLGSLGLIKVGQNILLSTNSERPHTIVFAKVKPATATQ